MLYYELRLKSNNVLTLLRYLRQITWAFFGLLVVCVIVGLIYVNTVGLPKSSYDSIQEALAEHGVEATIGHLRYHPLDGLIAEEVSITGNSNADSRQATIKKCIIQIDKTKALRGILRLEHLELQGANFSLPADPTNSKRGMLHAENCSASIKIFRGNSYTIENLRGEINGMTLELQTKLKPVTSEQFRKAIKNRHLAPAERIVLMRIINAMGEWTFEETEKPYLELNMVGDLAQPMLINSTIQLEAPCLQKGSHQIQDFMIDFNIQGNFIDIKNISFFDERGQTDASGYFDIKRGLGKIDLSSKSDFQAACNSFFGKNPLPLIKLNGQQSLDATLDLNYTPDQSVALVAYGNMSAEILDIGKLSLENASTEFSWSKDKFFARNLKSTIFQRDLEGQLLLDGKRLKIDFLTSLPLQSSLLMKSSSLLSELAGIGKITKEKENLHRLQAEIPLSILQ